MPTETTVEISSRELAQTVESVFGTMLDLEVSEGALQSIAADAFVAAVRLSGSWSGAVLVECGAGEACRFAGRFLSIPAPNAVDDVVRDVLGELANMIGGNLKCVLAPGTHLSLPSVVENRAYLSDFQTTRVCERIPFQCSEGPFWVTLLAGPS